MFYKVNNIIFYKWYIYRNKESMKKLTDILKKIDNILLLLNKVMNEEYTHLLQSQIDIKTLSLIIERKNTLLNQLNNAKKIRISIEQDYNIFPPYLKFNELNYYSNKIINQCVALNEISIKNKILTKNKFYLNQKFLNFYKSHENDLIYDIYSK